MELRVQPEPHPDFTETADLANAAFGALAAPFTPGRLHWLYERAFSAGTAVLGLYDGARKVGQVALVRQSVQVDGRPASAVALMDLFILQAFRSRHAIESLYGEVERVCIANGVRFILAVPNGKAAGVNARFLRLQTFLTLEIRVGFVAPLPLRRLDVSAGISAMARTEGEALLRRFLPGAASGLSWTPESLWERLQDPSANYGVHATEDVLLISSRRTFRHVPATLLCGLVERPGTRPAARQVARVAAAACRLHRRPLFVYVGVNAAVPLPGWSLPARLRPSPMVVQLRDLATGATPAAFDRFEPLDFDFA